MNTSTIELQEARALRVSVTDDEIAVDLVDGRTVVVPLAWYPRLVNGTRHERTHWRLIGRGVGIHWPDLDEDISVEGLLAGRPSGETALAEALAGGPRGARRDTGTLIGC